MRVKILDILNEQRIGKSIENALIEQFNKTVRQVILNINYFPTLSDAK